MDAQKSRSVDTKKSPTLLCVSCKRSLLIYLIAVIQNKH